MKKHINCWLYKCVLATKMQNAVAMTLAHMCSDNSLLITATVQLVLNGINSAQ